MRRAWLIILSLAIGCDSSSPARYPTDVKERYPAPAKLGISVPGKVGPAGSGSEQLFKVVKAASATVAPLDLLKEYLEEGGEEDRDLSITIALTGAPRVADRVVRFRRGSASRLDVERVGDHAFIYLQYNQGTGFDPDYAIGETHMLIEGSTLPPKVLGARVDPVTATGLSDAAIGYLRFYRNHRPGDEDDLRAVGQLDYTISESGKRSLHLTYTPKLGIGQVLPAGFWQQALADGSGFIYASEKHTGTTVYVVLAQYRADGAMAVWGGDGKLLGCYSGAGAELGTDATACGDFNQKFTQPPSNSTVWPGLPAGVPH